MEDIEIDVSEVKKLKSYTIISNSLLRDLKKIGLEAMGLMSFMISLPENWNYSVKGLAKCTGDNEKCIKNALKKLEAFGYLTRVCERDEKDCFTKNKYILNLEGVREVDYKKEYFNNGVKSCEYYATKGENYGTI